MAMPTGLGDALKKYFGAGTSKAGSSTTNLIMLNKQMKQAMAKDDFAGAEKIRKQINAITKQR